MPTVAVLASGWIIRIGSTEINGIEEFGFDQEVKEADKTTFSSGGNEEHYVALRGRTLKMSGYKYEDPADGTEDLGQAAVEALASAVGISSLAAFSLTSPGGNIRNFYASAKLDTIGGGKADNTKWGCTLKISGAIT